MTFDEWWNSDIEAPNPYEPDSAAYWAWHGWQAAVLAEREACAKVCDELFDTIEHDWSMMEGAGQCAAAIRARCNHA